MAKRVIRTTEQRTVVDRERPVQTVQEREVVRTLREPDGETVYDPGTTAPEIYTTPAPLVTTTTGLAALNARLRAQENWARQQSSVLHDIDYRLTNMEEGTHLWTSAMSLEQTTWWALWGILMLILGSALAVIVILIFASLIR
jgi:hypothetical protein